MAAIPLPLSRIYETMNFRNGLWLDYLFLFSLFVLLRPEAGGGLGGGGVHTVPGRRLNDSRVCSSRESGFSFLSSLSFHFLSICKGIIHTRRYIHACVNTCKHTKISVHIHTHKHTYTCIYITPRTYTRIQKQT